MARHTATLATWAPALLAALAPQDTPLAQGFVEHLWVLHGTLTRLRTTAAPPVPAEREDVVRQALSALDPGTRGISLSYGAVLDRLQILIDDALFPK